MKYAKCKHDNNNFSRSKFDTKLPACITRLLHYAIGPLADEISLFVRRMDDLGLKQNASSTVCFEQACNRLDQETALRYATYPKLGKSQGVIEYVEILWQTF